MVEQLICNQQVAGSTPVFGSANLKYASNLVFYGQMAEWFKATDCKSVHVSVRRFEPYSAHLICRSLAKAGVLLKWIISGSSSFGRAVAFQASGGRFEPGLPLQLVLSYEFRVL